MGKLGSAIKAGQTAIELGQNVNNIKGAASEFRSADKGELGRKAGRHAFNEGADTGKTMGKTWLKTFEVVPRMICRGLQFIFGLIACGFYASNNVSAACTFAIAISVISTITAVLFVAATPLGALPYIGSKLKLFKTYRAFAWDLILFLMWIIVFGIFAVIFLKRDSDDPYKDSSTSAMKIAVWIDLVNSIFWLTSGVYGCIKTFLGEKADELTDKMGQKMFEKKNKTPAKDDGYAESV
ncbi:uracil phosphoribosyltransferase [Fusarium albosuccineum]|uniref:Uracil phosphoribosyltransferase n=1 Tax=Fusarium albosuccineum TaxID=1237068 RepID=A0A8H4PGS7_9HYPO|nr:uracil phosphoribosyltransferase [Fusarium albosuccineum]